MTHAIEAVGVVKTFVRRRPARELLRHPFRRGERVRALRGVDLRVEQGEVFGLLGPNGAGKTTLLKILSCLILPEQGQVRIAGHDVSRERAVKSSLGLVHADERSFYWRLSARENLRFFARLYEVPGPRIEARIDELLERVDMLPDADRRFSEYSSGMKQRIAIARALLHDPPILLMDEPTRSLDPAASLALRRFIGDELRDRDGKTILLATHNLQEAQALSDHLAILVAGRVRRSGTVAEVRRWDLRQRRFRLELDPGQTALNGPFRVETDESLNGSRRVELSITPETDLNAVFGALSAAGLSVRSCTRVEPDLEQAFTNALHEEPEA